jgi:hypothetical protein
MSDDQSIEKAEAEIDNEVTDLSKARITLVTPKVIGQNHIGKYRESIIKAFEEEFTHSRSSEERITDSHAAEALIEAISANLGDSSRGLVQVKPAFSQFQIKSFQNLCEISFESLLKLHKETMSLEVTINANEFHSDSEELKNLKVLFNTRNALMVEVDPALPSTIKFDEVVYMAVVQKLLENPNDLEKVVNMGFDSEMIYLKLNEVLINPVDIKDEWLERCEIAIDLLVEISALKTNAKKTCIPFALGRFISTHVYPPIEVLPKMINAIQAYIDKVVELSGLKRDRDGNLIWPGFLSVYSLFIIDVGDNKAPFPSLLQKMLYRINLHNYQSQYSAEIINAEDAMNKMIQNLNSIFRNGKILLANKTMAQPYQDKDTLRRPRRSKGRVTPRWDGWYSANNQDGYIQLDSSEH